MIKGTKTNVRKISDKTQKSYYLLTDDHKPIGVCTSLGEARTCAEIIASKKDAQKVDDALPVYRYYEELSPRLIVVQRIRKLKSLEVK